MRIAKDVTELSGNTPFVLSSLYRQGPENAIPTFGSAVRYLPVQRPITGL